MTESAAVDSWMVTSNCGREFRAEAFSKISDIGPDDWPSSAHPRSVYLTYDWLKSQEGFAVPESRYLILRDPDGGLIEAALPCYIISDPEQVRFDNCPRMLLDVRHPRDIVDCLEAGERAELSRAGSWAREAAALTYPALVATAANAAMFGYAVPAGSSQDQDRQELESALIVAFDELADSLGCATRSFWYVRTSQFSGLADRLAAHGYARTLINMDSRLPVLWADLDEYIDSLPRNQRFNVRRELRDFRAAGHRVDVRSADALDLTLATQYAGLQRRYKHSGDPEAIMASYEHQREQIGGALRVFVTESAGEPLGFVLALQHDDVLYTRHAGFERGEGRSSNFVYFNTLFYAMIEYAIEQGVTRIEYGTESYDAKRRRGASMTELESFVKTTTAAPEVLADYLVHYERGVRAYLTAHGARFVGPEGIR